MTLFSTRSIALQLGFLMLLSPAALSQELDGQPLPDVLLVDFASSYCGPCREMVPLLRNMENDGFPIRKIDTTQKPQLSRQFGVQMLPTLVVLVEGKEVQRFEGFTDEKTLRRAVNHHAEKLHESRKAEQSPAATLTSTQPTPDQKKSGISSFFDRFRSSAPADEKPEVTEAAEVRAQSPDESPTALQRQSIPHRATVRVRLMDGKMRDVGTGTIIHSEVGKSLVLTCAHIFKGASADAIVEVDTFVDDKVLKYPATVLGGDHNADVALISIKTAKPLTAANVAFDRAKLQPRDALFSIGCSNGDPPTRLKMNVIEVNRFEGPATILCTNAPTQGRSGGGLFDADNRLVGICSAADYKAGEGLYCGLPPLQDLMKKLNLTSLKSTPAPAFSADESTPTIAAEDPSPFPADQGVFDALFGGDESEPKTVAAPDAMPASIPAEPAFANPFQTSSTATPTADASAEVTVIIKDPTAPGGQKVVVIPKASPWLLKLLTGQASSSANQLSTTAHSGFDSAPAFE